MRDRAARSPRSDKDLRTAQRARRAGGVLCDLAGLAAALALAAVGLGCREDLGAAEAARRGGADGALPPTAEVLPGALATCPCFVEAATTEVTEIPGGLSVTVKADRPGAVQEIRDRARLLAQVAADSRYSAPEVCPVVAHQTTVLPQEVAGGIAILVFPREAQQLEWVRQETNERLRGLATLHAARDPYR